MIEADALSKTFDDFLAVDRVSFQVGNGRVMVLLGPNGAGKTTTIRMLTSILVPSSGSARIAGHDVVQHPERVRAAVGVLTEHHGLYKRMNADEYLDFFGELYGLRPTEYRQRRDQLLEQFGLAPVRRQRLGEYSKGMRQKLALSRALIHEPSVLLLDEPTSAMDPASARMVRDAIHSLRSRNRAIILCTHNLAEAEELADQIVILRRGRIIFNETTEGLKRKLVGVPEYRILFEESVSERSLPAGDGIRVHSQTAYQAVVEISQPQTNAAEYLRRLVNSGYAVREFAQIEQSLEQAYLDAIRESPENAEGSLT
ncbi:MAG: ABC transporter ATP-binding protein [Anaerolineae bacterium]|nr:ABC transporter ATP-binding protein [Anaerolineae bacterium]